MLQCVAVCCSVLQCVAKCCSVLQCVAVCCSVLQCVAVCCSVLQCVAVCCSMMLFVIVFCSVLQCDAVCHLCDFDILVILPTAATHCNRLQPQHTATLWQCVAVIWVTLTATARVFSRCSMLLFFAVCSNVQQCVAL